MAGRKFTIGEKFNLKYTELLVTHVMRGSKTPSQFERVTIIGEYQLVNTRGGKYHMYDNQRGKDLSLSKAQLIKYIDAYNTQSDGTQRS